MNFIYMTPIHKTILKHILLNEKMSKSTLAKAIGMSKTRIGKQVEQIIKNGFLHENGFLPVNGPGRLQGCLEINPGTFYSCGISIISDCMEIGIFDAKVNLIKKKHYKNPFLSGIHDAKDIDNALTNISELFYSFLREINFDKNKICVVGFSLPGIINTHSGVILRSPFFPGIKEYPIGKKLSNKVNIPVIIEDFHKAKTYFEYHRGAGRGSQNMLYISSRSGTFGIIINRELFYGSGYRAGQTSAFVIDPQGPMSDWGIKGTLGSYFSIPAFLKQIEQIPISQETAHLKNIVTEEHLKKMFISGELVTCQIIREASVYLGKALCNLMTLLPVDVIVIDHWLSSYPECCIDIVKQELQRYVLANLGPEIKILTSKFEVDNYPLHIAYLASVRYFET